MTQGARLRASEWAVFGLLAAWLCAAAALVQLEYYDGLDAVANTRLFLGQSDHYVVSRAPLLSLMLLPAEWAKQWLALSPLDLRLHHAQMALYHFGYLLCAYAAIVHVFGRRPSGLVAFLAALPCFLFFSYAPFLSHDLLPGALLIGMLLLAERYRENPSPTIWLALVGLGAAAVLIKHSFALFWLLVLVSHAAVCLRTRGARDDEREAGTTLAAFVALFAAALLSAAIFWAVLAFVLGFTWPDEAAWLRPLRQIQHMAGQYDSGQYETFPWWLYARNLPAYGVATALLVVPGLLLSWRGTRLQRTLAISWLVAVVAMHVLAAREVRYLAFLAPVSALVIVPALELLFRRRAGIAIAVLVLAFDLSRSLPEAARIAAPFYTTGVAQRFLDPLRQGEGRPVLINWKLLSFRPEGRGPMRGDRYHRVFHVGTHHLGIFYGYAPDDFRAIQSPDRLALAAWPDGTWMVWSNGLIVNSRDQSAREVPVRQSVSRIESIGLRPTGAGYATRDGLRVTVDALAGDASLALSGEGLGERLRDYRMPRLLAEDGASEYALVPEESGRLQILGLQARPAAGAELLIRGFAIKSTYPPSS